MRMRSRSNGIDGRSARRSRGPARRPRAARAATQRASALAAWCASACSPMKQQAEGERAERGAAPSRAARRVRSLSGSARRANTMVTMPIGTLMREQPAPRAPPPGRPRPRSGRWRRPTAMTSAFSPSPRPSELLRIGEAHQRGVDAHDAGRAQPLDDPRDAQRQSVRTSAQASDAEREHEIPAMETRR